MYLSIAACDRDLDKQSLLPNTEIFHSQPGAVQLWNGLSRAVFHIKVKWSDNGNNKKKEKKKKWKTPKHSEQHNDSERCDLYNMCNSPLARLHFVRDSSMGRAAEHICWCARAGSFFTLTENRWFEAFAVSLNGLGKHFSVREQDFRGMRNYESVKNVSCNVSSPPPSPTYTIPYANMMYI